MPRYKALHTSYGFMGRYWEEGQISSPTDLIPPTSKVLGPLFQALSGAENAKIEETLAAEGGEEKVTMSTLTTNLVEGRKSKTGMNHKPKE
jgi:hypothetical protein